jgi:phytoene/squalene synthetase
MRDAAWGPAARVTRRASMQSYLTIRALADRAYRRDAFALYAYFRWLDDEIDEHLGTAAGRVALVARERLLLEAAADGPKPGETVAPPERLLVGLLRGPDGTPRADAAGARLSVASMLDVMAFDAARRGRPVTGTELDGYTHTLAVAVTEALHHCIGHGAGSPHDASRYVAVTGAHVAHMLRDLRADAVAGYLNVPAEVLVAGASPDHPDSAALRAWVRDRVELARACFASGRASLTRLDSGRCRLAGHAYIARFEWVLDAIERDGYRLRECYSERSSLRGGLAIGSAAVRSAATAARTPHAVGSR